MAKINLSSHNNEHAQILQRKTTRKSDIINNGKSKRRFNSDNKMHRERGRETATFKLQTKSDKATGMKKKRESFSTSASKHGVGGSNQKTRGHIVGRIALQNIHCRHVLRTKYKIPTTLGLGAAYEQITVNPSINELES